MTNGFIAAPDAEDLRFVVYRALAEDLRFGPDVTSLACVSPKQQAHAQIATRQPGVLAGSPAVSAVFDAVFEEVGYEVLERRGDGQRLAAGEVVFRVRAQLRRLLTAERTALNLLCHLSGIATLTAAWVDAIDGTEAVIRDTRKTLPGLRMLQKYAVRCGGGDNHRLGLGDAVLIKDNHVAAAGSVTAALELARAAVPDLTCEVEVEVDTLAQLDEALAAGAELVLLDNFDVPTTAAAVRRRDAAGTGTELESSGGLTLANARAYADTGVEYLAVGALTHSAPALDLGLDILG